MRGKGFLQVACRRLYGITPAYAGKRQQLTGFQHFNEDHPCICGEKAFDNPSSFARSGSPLHMRGKGDRTNNFNIATRITPAYAGKRLKRSRKIVLFKSTVNHFHLVCNRPDTANDNLQGLGAAAWF